MDTFFEGLMHILLCIVWMRKELKLRRMNIEGMKVNEKLDKLLVVW